MTRVSVPSLKSWQLKYCAFLTGLASAGTKAELQTVLQRCLDSTPWLNTTGNARTLVSVDMGIRNLAYCVLRRPVRKAMNSEPLIVTTWRRVDLLSIPANNADFITSNPNAATRRQTPAILDKTAFTPSQLSKTAYSVVRTLLDHNPDEVLIERQRFRSGGAAAIQEWTVRVNMLESMLWACLETLRATNATSSALPTLHAISPRRVADFWTAGKDVPLLPPDDIFGSHSNAANLLKSASTGRTRVEKSEKVDVVRSWISRESEVSLAFGDEAASIAEAFRLDKGKSRAARQLAGGKLDDLADCLLQAVAHVRWQENQEQIYNMLRTDT